MNGCPGPSCSKLMTQCSPSDFLFGGHLSPFNFILGDVKILGDIPGNCYFFPFVHVNCLLNVAWIFPVP